MSQYYELNFIADLCTKVAVKKQYPEELAHITSEMVIWLERHNLPGLECFSRVIASFDVFDEEHRKPQRYENGDTHFRDPILGGMMLYENYATIPNTGIIQGAEIGNLLMMPFLAMAAQENNETIQVSFLSDDVGGRNSQAARLNYYNGKSAFEGLRETALDSQFISLDRPKFLTVALEDPNNEEISLPKALVEKIQAI